MSSACRVFISYSHRDQAYKERLTTFLKIFGQEASFSAWDDGQIQASDDWRARIEAAMDEAKIAILLISADFLASDFIREHEIPTLRSRRNEGEVAILPVIVKPCPWKRIDWLAAIQVYPSDGATLSGADEDHDRELHYTAIAEEIYRLLGDLDAPDEEVDSEPAGDAAEASDAYFTPSGPLQVDGHYTPAGVIDFIERSSYLSPGEKIVEVLPLFRTKSQRTWLVSTNRKLLCVLDDVKTRARQDLVQWREPLQDIHDVVPRPRADKKHSGLVDIGRRQNWLYSFSLYPEPDQLRAEILGMVKRAMSDEAGSVPNSA